VNDKFRMLSSAGLALVLATMSGCPGDDNDDGATSVDGTTTGTPTTGTPDEETGTDPTGPEPQPDGASCMDNDECESGLCFVVGILGGICGECLVDDDCDSGGCSIPNPLKNPPEGAACNTGEQGEGCMSDDVCQGEQVCAVVLDVPGVFTAATCGECNDSSDCDGDEICNPHYDVAELSGYLGCVAPGSVALGEGCLMSDEGDAACASGHCATATVMGILELGVCSECKVDGDCEDGEVCNAPDVDLAAGLIAGTCDPA
jgi:hypothetical protein